MKVFFKKIVSEPYNKLIIYSSLNPIPFDLKLDNLNGLPETIYTRNLAGNNFIEFRFNKNTKQLYEITLVSVQNNTVKLDRNNIIEKKDFFECYIDEESELDISKPIQILRSNKSLIFTWGNETSISYFITNNCILGTDNNNNLCSFALINLNEETIFEILGF